MNTKRLLSMAASTLVLAALLTGQQVRTLSQAATAAATMVVTKAATMAATAPANAGAKIAAVYTLPDTALGATQNQALPGSIKNDRKMFVGGIGSDLWHGATDAPNTFWMISDRGPNGQIKVDDKNRRTFPVPEFDPSIYYVQVAGSDIKLLSVIPLTTKSGKPVTGLSNLADHDEVPYDFTAQTKLDFNPNGLDTEGLVRTAAGDFWAVEEYGPSLLKISKTGQILMRYLPEGLKYEAADYPVSYPFPAIFGKRKINRGFEGLTLSADEKTLYIALQSPLQNPDSKAGDASLQTRILAFDVASEKVTAEYVYRFDDAKEFGGEKNTASEMKISAMAFINPTTLLVEERTDVIFRLYTVDLSKATNILGTPWDDAKTAPSLEATTDLAAAKIVALPKTFVVEPSKFPEAPGKVEGIAILDKNTIAFSNDNDYDIGTFDADGNNKGAGTKSKIIVITLDKPLP